MSEKPEGGYEIACLIKDLDMTKAFSVYRAEASRVSGVPWRIEKPASSIQNRC